MQHQRYQVFFLFVWGLLFLTSCIPTGVDPAGNGGFGNAEGALLVPGDCLQQERQIFISDGREYCFAYPYGFYIDDVDIAGEENTVTLRIVSPVISPPTNEDIENMDDVARVFSSGENIEVASPVPLTLKVYDEQINSDNYPFDEFIKMRINRIQNGKEIYRIRLDSANAIVVSTTSSADNMLHVFIDHGDRYCHLVFAPSFINIEQAIEEEQLLKLFLTIVESFTFID